MCEIIYMARPRVGHVASDCCCEMSEYDMMFGNFGAEDLSFIMTVEVLPGYLRDKNMRDRLVLSIDDPEKGRAVVSKVVILYWAGGARRFTAENA